MLGEPVPLWLRRSLLALALTCLPASPIHAVNNRSVSGSQQFIVICADRELRQNLVGAFDDIRRGLFTELGIQLGAQIPIYVNITPRKIIEYNARTWNIRWLDAPEGARVQLDILIDDNIQEQRLQEHIVSALLLTIKYRDKPPLGGEAYTEAPGWMIEGLSEKIRQQTIEPDAALYRGLLNARNVPNLADWLKVDPARLDTTSLGIYRAYACSLIGFFQGEPNGNKKLREYLQNAPGDPESNIQWLAKAFPNIGPEAANLAKWWSLSLARLSAADRYVSWTGKATDEALEKALVLNITDQEEKKQFRLEDFSEFIKLPGRESALASVGSNLTRLTVHAHPLFRPVLIGYQEIVDQMRRGKLKNLNGKLDEMATLRKQIAGRLEEVSDYLTWFEATQFAAPQGGGEFDGYFRLMQSFTAARPPSKDPIGRYLDAMEAEMKN